MKFINEYGVTLVAYPILIGDDFSKEDRGEFDRFAQATGGMLAYLPDTSDPGDDYTRFQKAMELPALLDVEAHIIAGRVDFRQQVAKGELASPAWFPKLLPL